MPFRSQVSAAWYRFIVPRRSMYTGHGEPCAQQSTVRYQSRPHVSADKPGNLRQAQFWRHLIGARACMQPAPNGH